MDSHDISDVKLFAERMRGDAPAFYHAGRQTVVLLHGINSDGNWFDDATRALSPHFRCAPIHYGTYRRFLGAAAIIEPYVVLPGALVVAGGLLGGMLGAVSAPLLGSAVVIGGLVARPIRRGITARLVKRELDRAAGSTTRPHLIAHSFGTRLAAHILESYPSVEFDRIVLNGAVLSADYDWAALRANGRRAYNDVRNEVGSLDRVVDLAEKAPRLGGALGDAGKRGFTPRAWLVHNVSGPWAACTSCSGNAPGAPIHNVLFDRYGHGGPHTGVGHARKFWLAYLWGLRARELVDFWELCQRAHGYWMSGDHLRAQAVAMDIRDRDWEWAGGRIEDRMREAFEASSGRGKPRKNRIVRSIRLLINVIGKAAVAADEAERELAHGSRTARRTSLVPRPGVSRFWEPFLDPRLAVARIAGQG